uniref:Uncharacterized protein n=2 Tax=Octactis speculum TaxID=3111310 RepID=A0A7S2G3Q3_9STRA
MYLLLISPTLGLVSTHVCMLAADRYAYTSALFVGVPLFGVLFSSVLGRLRQREAKVLGRQSQATVRLRVVLTFMALIVAMGGHTWSTVVFWRSSESLWWRVIHVNPYRKKQQLSELQTPPSSTSWGAEAPRIGLESAFYNLGVTMGEEGRIEEAVSQYDRAIEINSMHPKSWSNRGILRQRQGQIKDAIHSFQRAVQLEPTKANHHYNLGVILMESMMVREAAEEFRRCVDIEPSHWKALNNLGNIQRALGHAKEAEESYRQCLEHRPTHSRAWKNLGMLVQSRGQVSEAAMMYRRALGIDPTFKEAIALLRKLNVR